MARSLAELRNADTKDALESMTPALQKVFETCHALITKAQANEILAKFDVGAQVAKSMADETKYGENAAVKLAAGLGLDTTELYRYKKVAETWSRDELRKLTERRSKEGERALTFSHIWMAASVPSAKFRNGLIEKFFVVGLTVREFAAMVQKELGRRGGGKGRPRIAPKGPSAGVAAMTRQTEHWLAGFDDWDAAIFDNLSNEPGKYASDDLIEELSAAAAKLQELKERVEESTRKTNAALSAVRQSAASKEAAKSTAARETNGRAVKRVDSVPARPSSPAAKAAARAKERGRLAPV